MEDCPIVRSQEVDCYVNDAGLGSFIIELCDKYTDRIFQVDADSGQKETFSTVKEKSIRVAIGLQKFGLKKGDIISMCSHNSLDSIIPFTAASLIGVQIAHLDPSLTQRELKYLIGLVKPKLIFTQDSSLQLIEHSIKDANHVPQIVVMGTSNKYPKFSSFVKEEIEETTFKPVKVVDIYKEIAVIFFSSGTTGLPKAICLSHYTYMVTAQIYATKFKEIPKVVFHASTMYWISASLVVMLAYLTGSYRVVTQNEDVENILQIFEKYKVNYAFLASYYSHKIVSLTTIQNYDFSALKCLCFGGAGIPTERLEKCRNLMRNNNIHLGYGSTEAGSFISMFAEEETKLRLNKLDSSGTLVPTINLKIVDIESNKPLGPNRKGEIRLKAKHFMIGYLNQDATEEFDEEGYLKTGDIGYYDEDKCLYIVSRIKEMFTYQSEVILPAIVEAEILKHPAVKEAVVFGIPHHTDEFLPAACVTLIGNQQLTNEQLTEFVNKRVSDKEKLRGGLKIVEQIPRNPSGKAVKSKLIDLFLSI